jgi:hypothetical protein
MAETLSKFGVPLGGGSGRGGILQPKYKYRFRVRVVNFGPVAGGIELTQQVVSVTQPSLSHEEVAVHSYNSTGYYAGKHTWETINLVIRDDITNSVERLVGHQMQKQLNHFEQTGFTSGVNYKFVLLIETMDGGNDGVINTWTLEGCFLQNVEFSELAYEDSSFQTITMSIRYDNATLGDGLMTALPESISGTRL